MIWARKAELLPSPAAQHPSCCWFWGESWQTKKIWGVESDAVQCKAAARGRGGWSTLRAHSELPAASAQEMTGAALQWKLCTASAKNSSEVKEVGTHSWRVISF